VRYFEAGKLSMMVIALSPNTYYGILLRSKRVRMLNYEDYIGRVPLVEERFSGGAERVEVR